MLVVEIRARKDAGEVNDCTFCGFERTNLGMYSSSKENYFDLRQVRLSKRSCGLGVIVQMTTTGALNEHRVVNLLIFRAPMASKFLNAL